MSAHQCPDCPLRFGVKTELEFHLREEHPAFRHDYPEHHGRPVRAEPGRRVPDRPTAARTPPS